MGISARSGPLVVYPGSEIWEMVMNGQLELRKIRHPGKFGADTGLFTSHYEDIPEFVPNNFLPKHWFLPQAEYEDILWDSIRQLGGYDIGT